jgi:glycosyltransferase involved in cell wall biosynthesis
MRFLWFTWKDKKNPRAGGAELINEEIAKRLVRDGHEVILLVGGFTGCLQEENIDGYKVIRLGNYWSVYLRDWADVVIEEINTIPFLIQLYSVEDRVLFFHQLCRLIWFYEMFFPLNLIGYILEPFYLFFMRKNFCLTVSESTRKDLQRFGFRRDRISVIPEGIEMTPLSDLNTVAKFSDPTLLSFGALRSMKRTLHQIRAFEAVRKNIPTLKMIIAGDSNTAYKKRVIRCINESAYKTDIKYVGRVDLRQKYELMRKSHLILVTSVKEGWGLIVTEAASQGTPAVVYDIDGLRDSVRHGYSGLICKNGSPQDMARKIQQLLEDPEEYELMRKNALEMSRQLTFEKCYEAFTEAISRMAGSGI